MKPVGYLVQRQDGLLGDRGAFYDYVLAGNGVFVEAEGPLLAARVPVAEAEMPIRGLKAIEPKFVLRHGLIPGHLWELALNVMLADVYHEHYVGVNWNSMGHYQLYVPKDQETIGGGVKYKIGDNVVLDLHSHCSMRAFFSPTDNNDEQGLKLFGSVGKLTKRPQVRLRVGVYGYFYEIPWSQIFRGALVGVDDYFGLTEEVEVDEGGW